MKLAVELDGTILGFLEGTPRDFDFVPAESGIDRFGANSSALSVSVPLVPRQRRDRAPRRRNWFAELLPEGKQYEYMLAQSGLKPGDTPSFLARYGRDIAGALQIWNVDDPTEPLVGATRALSEEDVAKFLRDPIGAPLANDKRSGKTSLPGVQPKITLVKGQDGAWAQALAGFPTTHILKPQLQGDDATIIFDEEYGARLSRAVGLSAFRVEIAEFSGTKALVIERYDRVDGRRVHQEDFSQVLGAAGNQKYQSIGGLVSLERVAAVLKAHASAKQMHSLARMVVFAVAIGNLDQHTKNLSLLHHSPGEVSLAPAYDVVPQVHMKNDGEVALYVNRKKAHGSLERADLVAEIASWGVRKPDRLIVEMLEQIDAAVKAEDPLPGAYDDLKQEISAFTKNLLEGRETGTLKRG